MVQKIDIALLRQLMRYDPETGKLFWIPRPCEMFANETRARAWNTWRAGKQALATKDSNGYLNGTISGHPIYAHRAAWAWHHGEWPDGQIDHINHDKSDNRIENLRVVSNAENAKNRKMARNNTSGVAGLYWVKETSKWIARIHVNKKLINLGTFTNIADAADARKAAERKHKFHENHGRI